ncbi:MAG: primosomal protein N' [Coriobacteriia bacterium]|nr:primosomal protein N' [Coriobacteriia bacterium]
MDRIARVIVDIQTRELSEPFDYLVPESLDTTAVVGTPVLVPFGPQRVVGYVVERVQSSELAELRELEAVLGQPLFMPWAFGLATQIASEYVATLADAMRLFLPPGGTPRVERIYSIAGPRPERGLGLAVYDAVQEAGELTSGALRRLGVTAPQTASRLVSSGALGRRYDLRAAAAGPVDDRWVELTAGAGFVPRPTATMQRAVLESLRDGPVRVSELSASLGPVDAAVRRLADEGALTVVLRRRLRGSPMPLRPAPRHGRLSAGQTAALAAIESAQAGTAILLHGVTGSGKTEVYLRAIERVVSAGGSAVVLVPEISLTPQTVGRFRSRFGDRVAVLHSRLSAGERFDQWDRARTGEASVVVGPRSALFAPVTGLRLVVIDEEHESSYKQGSAPRYHARDVARGLCRATGAVLVLGSATPSLETMESCSRGDCTSISMPERVAGGTVSPVTVVDMASEFADGHRSMFSRPLLAGLERVSVRREKAVLLMNRRGFASFLLCRDCGFVPRCSDCSVSLTYHEVGDRLVCHQCGRTETVPTACPKCGSVYLRQFGAGTQRVEAELAAAVPGLPIVRMDLDTTRAKGGHEQRLAEFEALGSGVLLGTQMIAKGLDYPDVTLVGVINADTTLHLPDFRAGERTYQLLEQVAGRTGRAEKPGEVIVQTYWPDHGAIQAVAMHDPSALYDEERLVRTELGYPPFGRLANVTYTGSDPDAVRLCASALSESLRRSVPPGWAVLGPSPAVIARIRGSYRWHVLIKAPAGADLSSALAKALCEVPAREGVSVAPDVDPFDLM